MLPLKAVWIDSETDLARTFAVHFNATDTFTFLSPSDVDTFKKIIWSEIDLLLVELAHDGSILSELVQQARTFKSNLPVVAVCKDCDKKAFIRAINLGVSGLVEKPIEGEKLKEIVNRFRGKDYDLKLCSDRKAVYSQSKWIDLTSTEYKILETLKVAAKRLTRAELQAAVWPNSSISENNLDTHLTNLKRKIPELITALNVKRGLGYYLERKM